MSKLNFKLIKSICIESCIKYIDILDETTPFRFGTLCMSPNPLMFWKLAGKGQIQSIDRTYSNPLSEENLNVARDLRMACAAFFLLTREENIGTFEK